MSDQLPSIDDFAEDLSKLPSSDEFVKKDLPHVEEFVEDLSKLPSPDDFIKEDLPSVEEFIEEEEIIEEQIQTLFEKVREEDKIEEPVSEETTSDLTEILHLIDAVRREIPEIPEIKYYDEELEKLTEYIGQVYDCIPEVKYYDAEVESICEQIDFVKEEIKDLPEVKYYDTEVEAICEQIDKVRLEIPDLSWVGETFSSIDGNFVNVNDHLEDIKVKFNQDIDRLTEDLDLKHFEKKVDIKGVKDNLQEVKDKVYEELKETASRIWDHHNEFKDDDRKLKKQILSQYNKLSQNIEKQITETKNDQKESANILKDYFEGLKDEISNLPEVKYYDNPIDDLKKDLSKLDKKIDTKDLNISELYNIVGELKEKQGILKEEINNRPVTPDPLEKQGNDPLTPTDQKFATLKDLAEHYRLFVNRVQQQLYTIGGGGAVLLNDLDDVNIDGLVDGNTLLWDASTSKWDVGAGGTWASDSVGVHTTRNVGIATTARSDYALYVLGDAYYTGNISAAGTITYDDVTNVDSIGIVTAGKGVRITTGGLVVTAGVSTLTSKLHVGVDTGFYNEDLVVNGDARITGILTIGTASITFDPNAKTLIGLEELKIGSGSTAITLKKSETTGEIEFADESGKETSVGIGTTVSINTTGIVTATSFSGNLPTTDLTGTITNAQLAGSIANAKLSNDSVSFGGVSLDLGGTDATPAFDLTDATNYPYTSLTGITTEIVGDTTPQLGGNLDLNSKNITGTGSWQGTAIADAYVASASTWDGKQSALTFGIANTNTLKVDDADAADNDYAKFTSTGIEGRSYTELKSDLSLNSVENTALSTWAGTTNITTIGTLGSLNVTGNVSVGGTLTYEDVTNIDSVGIVTARTGLKILAGGINAVGVITATGGNSTNWNTAYGWGDHASGGYQSSLTFGLSNGNSLKFEEALTTNDVLLAGTSNIKGRTYAEFKSDLSLDNVENTALSTWAGTTNITTIGTLGSLNVTGIITATTFSGALTGDVTGTATTATNLADGANLDFGSL